MKWRMFWFAPAKIDQGGMGHVSLSVKRKADAICAWSMCLILNLTVCLSSQHMS